LYSGTTKKTFTLNVIIKTIETALKNEDISESLIIHTDRGSQFTSKKFVDFVNNHPFLEGSQTAGGQPNQNPVVERMHRTFKSQLKNLKMDLPTNVKRTRRDTICRLFVIREGLK